MSKLPRRSAVGEDVLIVRVRRDTARRDLRGYVDLVATGERFYFTDVDDLTAYFDARLRGPDEPPQPPAPRRTEP